MKNFRLSFVLVMLALVLAIVPAVFAQEDTLGASQADYDLWTAANTTSGAFKTVAFSFTASVEAAGMGESDASANLSGTGVLSSDQANPQFQLDVTGSIVESGKTQPVNVGVRVVGGNLYYNDGTSGWKGTTLESAMAGVTGELGGLTGATGTGDLSSLSGMDGMSEAMTAFEGLQPSDFLKLTRVDEGSQAHFTLNLDIAKLLASPALAPVFGSVMGMAGGTTGSDAPAMTDAQAQQMQAMFGAMFSTATIALDEYVDPASSLVQRATLTINLPLDGIVGPDAAVKLSFDINLSNYDAPITVEAPADAVMEMPSS